MELKARKPLQQMWRIRNLMKYLPIKINVFLIKIHLLLKSKSEFAPASSSSLQSMTEWRKFKALQQKQHLFSDSQVSRKFQFLPYAIIWNLSALRLWCVAASRWIIPLHPQPLKKGSELLLSVGEDNCSLFPCEIYHCKSLSIKSLSLLSAEEILALDWLLSP